MFPPFATEETCRRACLFPAPCEFLAALSKSSWHSPILVRQRDTACLPFKDGRPQGRSELMPMSRSASYGPSNAGRRTSFCESGIAVGRIKSSHQGKSSSFLPQPSRETEKALWLPKSRRRSLPRLSSEL